MGKEQVTEKTIRQMLGLVCFRFDTPRPVLLFDKTVENIREQGYIKKTAREEFEDFFEENVGEECEEDERTITLKKLADAAIKEAKEDD